MTAFCAHPGCLRALHAGNSSGVCRDHMHGPACRCVVCTAPRKAKARRAGRRLRARPVTGPPRDDDPELPIPIPA